MMVSPFVSNPAKNSYVSISSLPKRLCGVHALEPLRQEVLKALTV